jgi:hypothetical protein
MNCDELTVSDLGAMLSGHKIVRQLLSAPYKAALANKRKFAMWIRSTAVLLGTAFAAALFAVPLATASAAPRALELAATPAPVPVHCEDGTCSVFLIAFCLQEKRRQPEDDGACLPTESNEITLIVNTQDGKMLTLPGREYVEFLPAIILLLSPRSSSGSLKILT